MSQRTDPCGCVVTLSRGHTHTRLCEAHRQYLRGSPNVVETFFDSRETQPTDNRDLVGG